MESYVNNNGNQQRQGSCGVRSSSSSAPAAVGVTAACSEIECLSKNVPVFLDRTFKMIGQVPDDVVCWSTAGDSFIIKQVLLFEEILPSFYNHKKFMSFVRQLNFYGFKKMKGTTSSRSKSGDGAAHGGAAAAAAAAALKGPESWEEYTHPQFRRGRPDLLLFITRKKDGGRLKRKRAESRQSGVLCTLATDVGTVSGDLKEVNNRLDNMMSVLLAIASGQHQAASAMYATPQSKDINTASSATAPTPAGTALGGSGQQWGVGGESGGSGATRQGAHNPLCAHGAPPGYCVAPSLPTDQQLRGWQGRSLLSRPTQQPCPAMLYSSLPNIRHMYAAPGGATSTTPATTPPAAARAPEGSPIGGPSHQQQPSQRLPLPSFSNVLSSNERNPGGRRNN